MNSVIRWRRGAIVALSAIFVAGAAVSPAAAIQDPGTPVAKPGPSAQPTNCPLTRVGVQFVRCDNLTGAGVSAPEWIPEH